MINIIILSFFNNKYMVCSIIPQRTAAAWLLSLYQAKDISNEEEST